MISRLTERVTTYAAEPGGPAAEVVTGVASLVGYAPNDNAAREGGVWRCNAMVAGAGFEPAAFRL